MEVSSDPLEDDLGLVLEPVSVLVPPEEVELAEGEVVICWPGDTSSELRPPDTQHIGLRLPFSFTISCFVQIFRDFLILPWTNPSIISEEVATQRG